MQHRPISLVRFFLTCRLAQVWLGVLVFNILVNAVSFWSSSGDQVHEQIAPVALELCASPEWNVAGSAGDEAWFFVAGVSGSLGSSFGLQQLGDATPSSYFSPRFSSQFNESFELLSAQFYFHVYFGRGPPAIA